MRIRQAEAILDAARYLRGSSLDIEMFPADHTEPGAPNFYGDDYMTGAAEVVDPDRDGRGARVYHIDIYPGPGPDHVSVSVRRDTDTPGDGEILSGRYLVSAPDAERIKFRSNVGGRISDEVTEKILRSEEPFRDAYNDREAARG